MDKLRLRFKKDRPRGVYIPSRPHGYDTARVFKGGVWAEIPEGFNPRPQISIALPLSVGTGSVGEVMGFKRRCETALDDFPSA